jgi:hypothetical protein
VADDGLHRLELNLHPNEASGLLAVEDESLLESHGWEFAFWAVLDEGEIEDCVAIIGHRRDAVISEGEELHLVAGDVDSRDKGSVLIRDYPGCRHTVATHFRAVLPSGAHSGFLDAEFVREFPDCRAWRASRSPAEAASSTSPTRASI